MKVSQVDLKALGIDPLRGRAKEGTGWPENNRDEKWEWSYYCLTCKLEVKRPYLCKAERHLNRSVYSPENPNWAFNRPPSLRPRCPQCKELDKLITKQQRLDYFQGNIDKIHHEQQRLKLFQKKWKKFRKKNYDLLFNNNNCKIARESLGYKDQNMWQCHLNLLEYIEDTAGFFMPRSESTKEDLKIVWELDHKYRTTRRQNETANLMLNSAQHEMAQGQSHYPRALDYYHRAIAARIDRTDLYLARSELYFVTGQYDKCITDCTIIINMIDAVHSQQKESGVYVKAYYNRAKAKKFLSRLLDAQRDLKAALAVDDEDMDCKKLLNDINTLLLLNKGEDASDIKPTDEDTKQDSADEPRLLFEGALRFMKTAEDKTCESEHKLFASLFDLVTTQSVYYDKFVNECDGMVLCLNYMRSKFKASNTKTALKDLGQPGLEVLVQMLNGMIAKEINKEWIRANVKLICNNILYIFTLYFYLHSTLQNECLTFAARMMHIKDIKHCIATAYCKPMMERLRKINIKMRKMNSKRLKAAPLDHMMLQCMLLFDKESDDGNVTNKKIATMYNTNEVLYEWMQRYIAYYQRLKPGDKAYDICVQNLYMILDGVMYTVTYAEDGGFYMLYNDNKQKQFGGLLQWMKGLKRIETDAKESEGFMLGFGILNALADKEHGRKYMLKNDVLYTQMSGVLRLIRDQKNAQLARFVDHIFRRLVQQQQDNEEQEEIEAIEAKERKKREAVERKEREERERKEREEKERQRQLRREKEEKEKEMRKHVMDGDLDALSDDDDEAYLKELHEGAEERKEKERKQKTKKKKKKKNDTDVSVIKAFVSKRDPAKFNQETMRKCFANKLSMDEIQAILAITADK